MCYFCLKFRVLSYFPHGVETFSDLHIYYRSKNITFLRNDTDLHFADLYLCSYKHIVLQVNAVQV